jgi:DNA-directed RNA polymerase specialized sigma subunit, sigma24 homolog
MINDLLLLNRIKNGDVQAFEKLFRSYYKPLCYYADSFLNDMDSAEEIVQNLFYLFWKDRADLQIRLSVKSYLFQSVQNKAFSYLKHLQVRDVYRDKVAQEELETSSFSPVDELEYRELESKFTSLLQRLPERQRRIFCMNRFGERSTVR